MQRKGPTPSTFQRTVMQNRIPDDVRAEAVNYIERFDNPHDVTPRSVNPAGSV